MILQPSQLLVASGLLACCLSGGCSPQQSTTAAAQSNGQAPNPKPDPNPRSDQGDGKRDGGQHAKTGTETRHEGPANRLARETSPYLLMHAHNPVDWYPWGSEALDKAKRDNKVIFLSVGYSSCHWCHVMERESFLDPEIAQFLNDNFVCIKVDREERPDVDAIYMKAVQVFSQLSGGGARGGWPMSAFLTPQTEPFFGGTYFPARDGDRPGMLGFLTLISRIQELWSERPNDLKRDAATLTRLVKKELDAKRPEATGSLNESTAAKTLASLHERYDPEFGGFGFNPDNPQQPKFPEPSNLLFLIQQLSADDLSSEDQKRTLEMLVNSLNRMAMGGIRDHLGGGFHRYSVDRFWRIPHFEKMLYDNGQLATVYAEAYRVTGRDDYRRVVEELLEFVAREMTAEGGGFYSALDAESESEEGKYYRWEKDTVGALLAGKDQGLFNEVYGLTGAPNFEREFYALQLDRPLGDTAAARELSEAELEQRLVPLRRKLLESRNQRPRPITDTKILTSWNGLMIRGFADAGRILESPRYVEAASRAAEFILENLRQEDGRLLRTYGDGVAKLNAYLDDYAFLVDGLIALYRASGDRKWLEAADTLTTKQIELFWDSENGGFFFTSDDHESLIARGRDPVDGAEPSGNSVSADNLVFLAQSLNNEEYLQKAERALQSASGLLEAAPAAAPRMSIALEKWLALQNSHQVIE
jgi:uncharacterized protein YyaL (SSP411 family)